MARPLYQGLPGGKEPLDGLIEAEGRTVQSCVATFDGSKAANLQLRNILQFKTIPSPHDKFILLHQLLRAKKTFIYGR